ncbi:proliferating cell nuclear antigen PcnA [Candidatus Korarchaeum cryptofilum]|jgi:proliferating cell nuclear antigen|uniref:DNA polymerase sliding clamp n=1 Tax=Korarchaeum cryptofilum (strain OPF8) TaxID=374847 RepID=B1L746_KORCO|nr:proliferating cell nuclear antigen PcnA [Candidatus Korarchaeum cryptofilum]ACB08275.1 proliferating cell nuclear antigen PcnA [Candidatus Korarchaeum cryptofilum OPF8]
MANRVVFEEAGTLKAIVEAVESLVGEASVKLDPDFGFGLQALDPSKTAMIQVSLPRAYFIEFEAESSRFYGIDFTDLAKMLKRVKNKERVELTFTESLMKITSMNGYRRVFEFPLLAGTPFEFKTIKVDFKARARLDSDTIPNVIKDLKIVGSDVEIYIDSEKVEFRTNSDRGKAVISITKEDRALIDIWAEEPSKSLYNMAYLEKMTKPADISEEADIELRTNAPLKLSYPVGGIEGAGITYYLAHLQV